MDQGLIGDQRRGAVNGGAVFVRDSALSGSLLTCASMVAQNHVQ